jgi:hypothetical protein
MKTELAKQFEKHYSRTMKSEWRKTSEINRIALSV